MTVTVDDKRCIGCGMCAAAVPEVFQVIGRVSTVLSQPAKERFFRVLDAANGCPVKDQTGLKKKVFQIFFEKA
ncbi:MAG: ferredoxin [Oscillibacter sp.]|nr:ferredoxin [Oscillibacter sp.]